MVGHPVRYRSRSAGQLLTRLTPRKMTGPKTGHYWYAIFFMLKVMKRLATSATLRSHAWEASALPLSYTRSAAHFTQVDRDSAIAVLRKVW